jgi:hypothetical protein
MRQMSNRLKFLLAVVVAAGLGAVTGFILGVRIGVWQFGLLDSSAKASVLTYELRALRAGQVEKIIRTKEIALDGEVAMFCQFLEDGHPLLFWPYNQYFDTTKYMGTVADYRTQYPPVAPSMEYAADNPMREELISYGKNVADCTRRVMTTYKKATHNPSLQGTRDEAARP